MKNLLTVLVIMILSSAVSAQQSHFGKEITEDGAVSMNELIEKTSDGKEIQIKVVGKIEEVCQAKGCWMTIEKGDGTSMRVRFKDYGFFVPKNASGKTAVFEGRAFFREVSVEELKHYAEDAGKTQEEIDTIKEGGKALAFEAEGVINKD